MAIFRIVASTEEHPGAEEIYRQLHSSYPNVSLDTVYRSLWLLADLGLISTVGPRRESVRFDANSDRHHHFTCVRCGLIRDFQNTELGELDLPTEAAVFGRLDSLHVEIRGVCSACLQAESSGQLPDQTSNKKQRKIRRES